MNEKDLWNYVIAIVLTAAAGLPLALIYEFGLELYIGFLIFCVLFYALFAWNAFGDVIIMRTILKSRSIENDAAMLPIIRDYYREKTNVSDCKIYYTQSSSAYFVVLTNDNVVVSLGAEPYIIQNGIKNGIDVLNRCVDDEAFAMHSQISQKVLLLSLITIPIARWIATIISTLVIRITQFIFGLAMVIATGASSFDEICNSYALGRLLARVLNGIVEGTSLLQDQLVALVLVATQQAGFCFFSKTNQIS